MIARVNSLPWYIEVEMNRDAPTTLPTIRMGD
jgi:hypothetical protein